MNMLGVGSEFVVFAGKSKVYFRLIPNGKDADKTSTNGNPSAELPAIEFPSEWKAKEGHIECIAISNDDKMIAVGDSMHGVHLFKQDVSAGSLEWRSMFSEKSDKRVIKFRFTDDCQFLTFLDKQGDIFAMHIPTANNEPPIIKKIMGHTSFISDYIVRIDAGQIISCDRDEKIRVSNFPDAFIIQGFKLGHTESVISVSVIRESNDQQQNKSVHLLSISVTGTLILWDLTKPVNGTETNCVKSWNIRELLPETNHEDDIKEMKCSKFFGDILISTIISRKVAVFKLSLSSLTIDLMQEFEEESGVIGTDWSIESCKLTLFIYTPIVGSLRWWQPPESAGDYNLAEIVSDLEASVDILKPSLVPMKKRLTAFEESLCPQEEIKKAKT